ncbi:MAG: hypothetical protein PHU46_14470 [Rhodocyclaceae bacterium]|nr:hypothetical protein [Rhodocyclaceae bacterium]
MKLEIRVGESFEEMQLRSLEHARRIDAGDDVEPMCGIGFDSMAQLSEVFTPKRWELVEALKKSGPVSIYALAKGLGRHYRNVHQDVAAMMEWLVIEKDEAEKIFVPWDEIAVLWPLMKRAA